MYSVGIDISAKAGEPDKASASGKVDYAGAGIKSYGNLLILRHSDDWLTAYAHNQQLLVKENQTVKAGQTIARMGNSGTDRVKLHSELRYKGNATDPRPYLR